MKFTVIIPSRYGSTRLPGKPLVDLCGKPMVQRVWEQAVKSGATKVIIATDDLRVKNSAEEFGAEVFLTDKEHHSGTDRLAEVCAKQHLDNDEIIVNVQGDEPLIPPQIISQVAKLLSTDQDAQVATLSAPLNSFEDASNPNVVKVVSDNQLNALYFSRSMIPYDRDGMIQSVNELSKSLFRHIGIYAYRAGFLQLYTQLPQSSLEKLEKLEQLRVLQAGYQIKVEIAAEIPDAGVDTQEDVNRIIRLLQ